MYEAERRRYYTTTGTEARACERETSGPWEVEKSRCIIRCIRNNGGPDNRSSRPNGGELAWWSLILASCTRPRIYFGITRDRVAGLTFDPSLSTHEHQGARVLGGG